MPEFTLLIAAGIGFAVGGFAGMLFATLRRDDEERERWRR